MKSETNANFDLKIKLPMDILEKNETKVMHTITYKGSSTMSTVTTVTNQNVGRKQNTKIYSIYINYSRKRNDTRTTKSV